MKKLNIIGEKYNKLLVVEEVEQKGNNRMFKCLCDCGNTTIVAMNNMRSGKIVSCGCNKREKTILRSTTHNQRHTHLYEVWKSMKQRCYNPKLKAYKNWGARGIEVCEEWRNNFQAFYDWSYDNGYTIDNHKKGEKIKLTIDRINVNGNYEPTNCRWVERSVQSRNRRVNKIISYKNEEHCLVEWCEILNISYRTTMGRLRRGWSIEKTFTTPTNKIFDGTH
jgi:hypothetical protein